MEKTFHRGEKTYTVKQVSIIPKEFIGKGKGHRQYAVLVNCGNGSKPFLICNFSVPSTSRLFFEVLDKGEGIINDPAVLNTAVIQYSLTDVKDALKRFESMEPDELGNFWYYLHYNDSEGFVPRVVKEYEGKNFCASADFLNKYYASCLQKHPNDRDAANNEFWSHWYRKESFRTNGFYNVVSQLTQELNEYLSENDLVGYEKCKGYILYSELV